jgi:hypothetical protein
MTLIINDNMTLRLPISNEYSGSESESGGTCHIMI